MEIQTTVDFVGLDISPALREDVLKHAGELEHLVPADASCHVTIAHAENRHRHGNRFVVHARLNLPGTVLEAGHTPVSDETHEDPQRAIVDAFAELRRQLEEFLHRQRGEVKAHDRRAGS
ncbi:MAG TPA: HPF/RaiA family ribosome-associated protein [Dokdonella sp.]